MQTEYNENHCRLSVAERSAYIRRGVTPREVEYHAARSGSLAIAARRVYLSEDELRDLMNDWGITATASRKALGGKS